MPAMRRSGAPRLYPWEKWFKMRRFALRKGRDYKCLTSGMAGQIRNEAYRRNLRVRVLMVNDGLIQVQVLRNDKG